MRLLITLEGVETGMIVGECPSHPGCISQGETEAEAIENVREAIQVHRCAYSQSPAVGHRVASGRSGSRVGHLAVIAGERIAFRVARWEGIEAPAGVWGHGVDWVRTDDLGNTFARRRRWHLGCAVHWIPHAYARGGGGAGSFGIPTLTYGARRGTDRRPG